MSCETCNNVVFIIIFAFESEKFLNYEKKKEGNLTFLFQGRVKLKYVRTVGPYVSMVER